MSAQFNTWRFMMLCGLVLLAAMPSRAQTCVSRMQPSNPSAVYTFNAANNTVTDTRTGLVWDRCVLGLSGGGCATGSAQTFTWDAALAAAATANSAAFKGHTDWRVPNIKELLSLVEHCRFSPAINELVFPGTTNLKIWSASPINLATSSAWTVDFSDGSGSDYDRGNALSVRLVRAGQ
ncbi:MAG: DUF1566 domain-containing protein [Betaproteobacteria bacterium]|nr:MAG: DUF1566 domain-containing protein [Betaproteobacteria bacterium]